MNAESLTLSEQEQTTFNKCVDIINAGPLTAEAIGMALCQIQDQKLYRGVVGKMETFFRLHTKVDPDEGFKIIEEWRRENGDQDAMHDAPRSDASAQAPDVPQATMREASGAVEGGKAESDQKANAKSESAVQDSKPPKPGPAKKLSVKKVGDIPRAGQTKSDACAGLDQSKKRSQGTGNDSVPPTKAKAVKDWPEGKSPVTMEIELGQIEANEGTESRPVQDEVVKDYAELIRKKSVFPPIDVFEMDGKYFLADGFHRFTAAKLARKNRILANVRPGGRLDALKAALGANETHGLRRSAEDKKYATDKALKEFANLSDRAIAEMCRVSPTFVGGRRNLQTPTVHVDSSSGDEQSKRLGRDGKARRQPRRPAAEKDKTVSAEALSTESQEPADSPETASDVSSSGKFFRVVQHAQKLLSKQCSRLRKAERPVFWERIAILADKEAGLYRDEARRAAQARSSGG